MFWCTEAKKALAFPKNSFSFSSSRTLRRNALISASISRGSGRPCAAAWRRSRSSVTHRPTTDSPSPKSRATDAIKDPVSNTKDATSRRYSGVKRRRVPITGTSLSAGTHTRLTKCQQHKPKPKLSGQSCDSGSFEAQLSDRPADRPHTQTCPGCAHPLVMFQEYHRLAGVFAASPSALVPSEPCRNPRPRARRSPPPPRARGPVRFSPQPGQPASWLHDSTSSTRAPGVRATLIALQTDEQITPIKRHGAAAVRVRHRLRSFEDRGGRSPLIIKDLYPQPPTNTHSPTHNSEELSNLAAVLVV